MIIIASNVDSSFYVQFVRADSIIYSSGRKILFHQFIITINDKFHVLQCY